MAEAKERSHERAEDVTTWYLERAGQVHGPFTRPQILRGLADKTLLASDRVRREGETDWRPLDEVPELSFSLPPAPASRRSARLPLYGGAAALLGLVIVGALAWGLASRSTSASVLPIDPHRLPSSTRAIRRSRVVDPDTTGAVSPAFAASALASAVCGGEDVAATLFRVAGASLSDLRNAGALELLAKDRAKRSLVCGEAVRSLLADAPVTQIEFLEGDDRRMVTIAQLSSTTDAPLGDLTRHTFSGLPGQCRVGSDGATCEPRGPALFTADGHLVFGDVESVEVFARSYASPRTELSTNVQILVELAETGPRPTDTVVLEARPAQIPWSLPCQRAAPLSAAASFLDACFPRGQASVISSIEAKTRGLVVAVAPVTTSGEIRVRFTLLARDAEATDQLERDVGDLARDWRSHVENREADLVRLLRAPAESELDRLWTSLRDPYLRSLRSMQVERSGETVSLVIAAELRDGEELELREHLARRDEARQAVVEVVDALRQGGDVPQASLAAIVGSDVAAWMLLPRATLADCDAFRQRLATLAAGPVPPRLFGLRYQLDQRLSPAQCVGAAIPPTMRDCVQAAADLEQLAACRFADSPFVAAARRRVAGQWVVEEVGGFDLQTRRLLQTARMQITETRIAFELAGSVQSSELIIESSSEASAVLQIPLGDDAVPLEVTFEREDRMTAQSLRGERIVFQRSRFAADLPMEAT